MLEQKVFLFCCSDPASCTFRSYPKDFPRCVSVLWGPARTRTFLVSDMGGMGLYSRKSSANLT